MKTLLPISSDLLNPQFRLNVTSKVSRRTVKESRVKDHFQLTPSTMEAISQSDTSTTPSLSIGRFKQSSILMANIPTLKPELGSAP